MSKYHPSVLSLDSHPSFQTWVPFPRRANTRLAGDDKLVYKQSAMTIAAAKSVDPAEVEKFSRMAAEWWDPTGKFAPLRSSSTRFG